MIIWAIRFLFASLNRLDRKRNDENKMDENIKHPAEFGLRQIGCRQRSTVSATQSKPRFMGLKDFQEIDSIHNQIIFQSWFKHFGSGTTCKRFVGVMANITDCRSVAMSSILIRTANNVEQCNGSAYQSLTLMVLVRIQTQQQMLAPDYG